MIYYTVFANGCQVKRGYELWIRVGIGKSLLHRKISEVRMQIAFERVRRKTSPAAGGTPITCGQKITELKN